MTDAPSQTTTDSTTAPITQVPCPRCRKLTPWAGNPDRPFCSERCKMIDLGAWASEDYKVAAESGPLSGQLGQQDFQDD